MNADISVLTVGTVVDTNDPEQMGRLRVNCPKWGDTEDTLVVDLPWAAYVSPFGGILTRGTRGPEEATTEGPVAYGMWAIPKVGATVVCMLLDGDANHRVWLGSIHAEHMAHTLPSGRYLDGGVVGPVSSTEKPIEPLASNMDQAFGPASGNYERLTRGAENQAASISNKIIDKVVSSIADDRNDNSRTGYQASRVAPPGLGFEETGGNFDPQTYSITTPGLHSFVMDDSVKNGKVRIRSTSGNQVILDDTNERIYVSTPEGNNWIEMDRAGNMDAYTLRRMSFHAGMGFNFITEGDFRISANNIHFRAQNDIRMHVGGDIGMLADQGIYQQAIAGPFEIESGADYNLRAQTNVNVEATTQSITMNALLNFTVVSGSTLVLQTGGGMSMTAGSAGGSGTMDMSVGQKIRIHSTEFSVDTDFDPSNQGPIRFNAGTYFEAQTISTNNGNISFDTGGTGQIHFNSGMSGTPASTATPTAIVPPTPTSDPIGSEGLYAYTVNRVPIHEPWGRISNDPGQTDQDSTTNLIALVFNVAKDSSVLELPYTSANANKVDLGDNLGRNNNWHR